MLDDDAAEKVKYVRTTPRIAKTIPVSLTSMLILEAPESKVICLSGPRPPFGLIKLFIDNA